MGQLLQNPRIADVRMREASNASRWWTCRRDRNSTKGLIMYEFQRNDSSKLLISKLMASAGLDNEDRQHENNTGSREDCDLI